ncbi:hypothetical protein WICPIJ_010156 [Wickerhamomyces pijperi]|uniref:MARVEL domain-containing protein n=1 Tax=Wickerhamomyces pijperi TaxID=599730 RepID=A0A9P8PHW5_WICPI|nr:hypothetical protein WICPIJ_010156 [Wickerhamomyces pijperi]
MSELPVTPSTPEEPAAATTSQANPINPIVKLGAYIQPYALFLRGTQLLFSILILGLTANTVNYFTSEGSNIWSLIVSLISLIYLIVISVLGFYYKGYLIPGAIAIVESLIAIFYFTSFIAEAADFGGVNCSLNYSGWLDNYYYNVASTIGGYSSACKTAKASIAFSCFNFVLFLLTSLLVSFQVALTLSKNNSGDLWKFAQETGVEFDNSVLNIVTSSTKPKPINASFDEEATVGGARDINPVNSTQDDNTEAPEGQDLGLTKEAETRT